MSSAILIPPSEGKAIGGENDPWAAAPAARAHPLFESRRRVIAALDELARTGDAKEQSKCFGVRGDLLTRAVDANSSIQTASTLPAIERYDGVLYQYLDAASLGRRAQRELQARVRIASGLWGPLSPKEPIPDYRLKMSASLPRLGKLSRWWQSELTEYLWGEFEPGATVWNLLPNEHAKSWAPPSRATEVSVVFLSEGSDGELRAVAHWNKALKGTLVAHLVSNPELDPEDLLDWEHPEGFSLERDSLCATTDPDRTSRRLRFIQI